jgi:hypothetical protein
MFPSAVVQDPPEDADELTEVHRYGMRPSDLMKGQNRRFEINKAYSSEQVGTHSRTVSLAAGETSTVKIPTI